MSLKLAFGVELQPAHGLSHSKYLTILKPSFIHYFQKTWSEIKWSDVASSRGWCRRGSGFPGSSRAELSWAAHARGGRVGLGSSPTSGGEERGCAAAGRTCYMVQNTLCWPFPTPGVRELVGITSQLRVCWSCEYCFTWASALISLINRLPSLLKCPLGGKNPRFLFPVMNALSSFSPDLSQTS